MPFRSHFASGNGGYCEAINAVSVNCGDDVKRLKQQPSRVSQPNPDYLCSLATALNSNTDKPSSPQLAAGPPSLKQSDWRVSKETHRHVEEE